MVCNTSAMTPLPALVAAPFPSPVPGAVPAGEVADSHSHHYRGATIARCGSG
jgi:hypothetical protein